ncbi:hypothetical protein FNF29_04892 [Cafeteria roenbergensis]|uniref:Uncharacterized protein n=1 Tax=Cafeteria roenbergensis TaxID=33653 RepID=A0A5A8CDE7_CAFRO|nr:hypothetical protein FNF29_04892 [Cafeteria roenbergensis]|eukprot:KAA0151002.1 hypothetical protein FNF29_04892 [Cafeteria roenbergensis]
MAAAPASDGAEQTDVFIPNPDALAARLIGYLAEDDDDDDDGAGDEDGALGDGGSSVGFPLMSTVSRYTETSRVMTLDLSAAFPMSNVPVGDMRRTAYGYRSGELNDAGFDSARRRDNEAAMVLGADGKLVHVLEMGGRVDPFAPHPKRDAKTTSAATARERASKPAGPDGAPAGAGSPSATPGSVSSRLPVGGSPRRAVARLAGPAAAGSAAAGPAWHSGGGGTMAASSALQPPRSPMGLNTSDESLPIPWGDSSVGTDPAGAGSEASSAPRTLAIASTSAGIEGELPGPKASPATALQQDGTPIPPKERAPAKLGLSSPAPDTVPAAGGAPAAVAGGALRTGEPPAPAPSSRPPVVAAGTVDVTASWAPHPGREGPAAGSQQSSSDLAVHGNRSSGGLGGGSLQGAEASVISATFAGSTGNTSMTGSALADGQHLSSSPQPSLRSAHAGALARPRQGSPTAGARAAPVSAASGGSLAAAGSPSTLAAAAAAGPDIPPLQRDESSGGDVTDAGPTSKCGRAGGASEAVTAAPAAGQSSIGAESVTSSGPEGKAATVSPLGSGSASRQSDVLDASHRQGLSVGEADGGETAVRLVSLRSGGGSGVEFGRSPSSVITPGGQARGLSASARGPRPDGFGGGDAAIASSKSLRGIGHKSAKAKVSIVHHRPVSSQSPLSHSRGLSTHGASSAGGESVGNSSAGIGRIGIASGEADPGVTATDAVAPPRSGEGVGVAGGAGGGVDACATSGAAAARAGGDGAAAAAGAESLAGRHGGSVGQSTDSALVDVTAARSTVDSAVHIVTASQARDTAQRHGQSAAAAAAPAAGAARGSNRSRAASAAGRSGFWGWVVGWCAPPRGLDAGQPNPIQRQARPLPGAGTAAVSAEPVAMANAVVLPACERQSATATETSAATATATATDVGPGSAVGTADVPAPHRSPSRRPLAVTSSQVGSSVRIIDDSAANSAKSRKSPASSVGLRTIAPAVSPEHRKPPIRVVGTGGSSSATTTVAVSARLGDRGGSDSGRQDTSGSLGSAVASGVGQTSLSLADATTSAACRDGSAGLAPA